MIKMRRIFFAVIWFAFLGLAIGPFPLVFFFSLMPGHEYEQANRLGQRLTPFLVLISGIITIVGAHTGFLPGTENPAKPQKWGKLARGLSACFVMLGICIFLLAAGKMFAQPTVEKYLNTHEHHS